MLFRTPGMLAIQHISKHRIIDITGRLKITNRNLGEVSHFSFSSDGSTLTETKDFADCRSFET
jgi:hypothetical protein